MAEYETVCILKPDLAAGRIDKVKDKVHKVFADAKGEILLENDWGKRKLAYRMEKCLHGQYLYFNYKVDGSAIAELERILKYEEEIIRFLTVKIVPRGKAKRVTQAPEEVMFKLEAIEAQNNYRSDYGHDRDSDEGGFHAKENE